MSESFDFVTPVGRIVAGNPFHGQTLDAEGRELVYKTGEKAGQPRKNYYVGLAIAKTDSGWSGIYDCILKAAQSGFPNLFPGGQCINPNFAFKITDGDSQVPNSKGIAPASREGFPGNWILHFSSSLGAIRCYDKEYRQLNDPNSVKCGYYVRIAGKVTGNGSLQQPGVYLNPDLLQLCGYGPEISTGKNAAEAFKNPASLPAGASATPPAPVSGMPAPGATAAPGMPGATAAPGMPPIPAGVTPAPGFSDGPGIPPPPAGVAPQPVAAPVSYTVNGQTYTKEQLLAAGWNETAINNLPSS